MYKLESDIKNADAGLNVKFYSRFIPNEFESEKQQRSIGTNVDFIKITIPGNDLNNVDTIANDQHKARFPLQWAAYKNMGESANQMVGTPIADWPRVDAAMSEELRSLKFLTVESVAHASDAHLQSIGMIAGQSAFSFRDDARRFLAVASDNSAVKQAEEKAKKIEEAAKEQNERHAKEMQELKEQMAMLISSLGGEEKRSPGRPAKRIEQEAA